MPLDLIFSIIFFSLGSGSDPWTAGRIHHPPQVRQIPERTERSVLHQGIQGTH